MHAIHLSGSIKFKSSQHFVYYQPTVIS